jgi:lipoyl(octanoyl) transferase
LQVNLKKTLLTDIGTTEYAFAWELQKILHQERVAGNIPDIILFTEHRNTYTIGKSGGDNHLLAGEDELARGSISVFKTDRGGDITYHGPGQIVCYPIIDLNNYYQDIHRYLRDLEEVVIRTLEHYGIQGSREPEYTGVWVDGEKICAIGVKVSRWVTMHGFAFNVNTDLSYFGRIIPCGIFHKGVTSLAEILGRTIELSEVRKVLAEKFTDVFQTEIESVDYDQFFEKYHIAMEKEHASS